LDDKSRWTFKNTGSMALSGLGTQQFLSVNRLRKALVLSAFGGTVFVGSDGATVNNHGVALGAGGVLIWELTYDFYGAGLCGNWFGFTSAPATGINWIECEGPVPV
jgi:hypothetical protein